MGEIIPKIATTAAQTFSTFSKSRAQSAAVAYQNAILRQQAEYQRQLAQAEATRIRHQSDRILGQNAAKFAASGMDIGSGSALLIQESFASEAEISALEARNRGHFRAQSISAGANFRSFNNRIRTRNLALDTALKLSGQFGSGLLAPPKS